MMRIRRFSWLTLLFASFSTALFATKPQSKSGKAITKGVSQLVDARGPNAIVIKGQQLLLVNLDTKQELTLAPLSKASALSRFSENGAQVAFFAAIKDQPGDFEIRVYDIKNASSVFRSSKLVDPVGLVWSGCRIGALTLQQKPIALLEFDVAKGCPDIQSSAEAQFLYQSEGGPLVVIDRALNPVSVPAQPGAKGIVTTVFTGHPNFLAYSISTGGIRVVKRAGREAVAERSSGLNLSLANGIELGVFEDPKGRLKLLEFAKSAQKNKRPKDLGRGSRPLFVSDDRIVYLKGDALHLMAVKNN
jgi:hypothetical protein